MKKVLPFLLITGFASATVASAQSVPTVFDAYPITGSAEKTLSFDPTGTGEQLPIVWGLDCAQRWQMSQNFTRGMRYMTPGIIDVVRVSYTPDALVTTIGELPQSLHAQLNERMAQVERLVEARGGKKVDVALNQDASIPELEGDYYYLTTNEKGEVVRDWEKGTKNHDEWAKVIDATTQEIQRRGYNVVSIAPFNEPDYPYNGLHQDHFMAINKAIRANHPNLANIRLSGGNTLNCDCAADWYNYLKEDLQEGNTHQLAGIFDNYASFFSQLRDEGKYATADELHNIMEAMVGVEYGMQQGIWWGTAERARGEFCQASNFGERLGYAENRYKWAAASVYKSPGKVQAFMSNSERQAIPCDFSFVSTTKDVYVEGRGPLREFTVDMPGDAYGTYATIKHRNAEGVYNITWGEDVQPEINGTYYIVNKADGKPVITSGVQPDQLTLGDGIDASNNLMKWNVGMVPTDEGGDFSFYFIDSNADPNFGWNLNNFGLNDGVNGKVYDPADESTFIAIIYYGNLKVNPNTWYHSYDNNMKWYLQYAGNGWFHIRSMYSDYCVRSHHSSNGSIVLVQAPYDPNDDTQLFRFVPVDNNPGAFETTAPSAPTGLTATAKKASVKLTWDASADADFASFSVLRADADGEFNTIARNITGTALIDNTTHSGKSYTYKVVAYDRCGNRSTASADATVVTESGRMALCVLPLAENLLDISGNDHHARAAKEQRFVSHASGKALRISGIGSLPQLPVQAVPDGSEFTVSARIWPEYCFSRSQYVFSFGCDLEHYVSFCLQNDEGKMELAARNGGEEMTLQSDKELPRQFSHVAVTLADNCWVIYLNGEEIARLDQPGIGEYVPDKSKVLNYIGRATREFSYRESDGYEVTYPFLTAIADFHIYNYALSSAEVAADKDGNIAAVTELPAEQKEVLRREYFNISGQQIAAPVDGQPVIVRTHYTDGTVSTIKKKS